MSREIIDGKEFLNGKIDSIKKLQFVRNHDMAMFSPKLDYEGIHSYIVFNSEIANHPNRNIVLMYKKDIWRKGRHFLKLIGADIFTQKIVNLIDNRGKEYGLCSYDSIWDNVNHNTLFKVTCKWEQNEYLNTLRMVSGIQVLGQSNLLLLAKKMIYDGVRDIIPFNYIQYKNFKEILSLKPGKWFFARILIYGNVKKRQSNGRIRYSLCIENRYAEILEPIDELKQQDNHIYRGFVLISGIYKKDQYNFKIHEMQKSGRFYDNLDAMNEEIHSKQYSVIDNDASFEMAEGYDDLEVSWYSQMDDEELYDFPQMPYYDPDEDEWYEGFEETDKWDERDEQQWLEERESGDFDEEDW